MSHRDVVENVPPGFEALARTDTCAIAAHGRPCARPVWPCNSIRKWSTPRTATEILVELSFRHLRLRDGLEPEATAFRSIEARHPRGRRRPQCVLLRQRRRGFDCRLHALPAALGPDRVCGIYVDTGLMREGETEFVRQLVRFARRDTAFRVEHAAGSSFSRALAGVCDPEQKRHIIGEQFVEVQERDPPVGATSSTATGFSGRAPSIPTPSNPAERRKRT